jgi:hypothetical protein
MMRLAIKKEREKGFVTKREKGVAPIIDTVAGKALFVRTEKEDEFGRWNDNYFTKDGYWVIHQGKKHHVYKVI